MAQCVCIYQQQMSVHSAGHYLSGSQLVHTYRPDAFMQKYMYVDYIDIFYIQCYSGLSLMVMHYNHILYHWLCTGDNLYMYMYVVKHEHVTH